MRLWRRFTRWLRRQAIMPFCGHEAPGGYAHCEGCHTLCCPGCFAQHVTEHYPMSAAYE